MSSPSPLLVHVGDQRDRIERAMLASVTTTDAHLTELASHLIVAGGKRLRPVLTVIAGSLDGRAVSDDVVLGGVSCELVHLGSLYHDDVMDESETRRGVETVNARWGNLQAILAGDFLLARASEIAAGLGTEVAGLLARTIGWLCEGQIEELRHTYDVGRTEESYLTSIHGKTASLYGTAARVGGIVAGLSDDEIDALTDFGNAYGMVFQIVDDLLDLTATDERLGKRAGHDMEVGVYTLPVIHTLSVGSATLEGLLGGPLHGPEAERALEIVRSGPGIESTISRARDFVNDAVRACSVFPEGPARSALEEAPAALLASALSPTA